MKIKELLIFWLIITTLFFSFNCFRLFVGENIELKSKVIYKTDKTKNKYDKRTFTLRNEYGLFTMTEDSFHNPFNKKYDDIECGDSITAKLTCVNWYKLASNDETKSNITKLYNSSKVTENMDVYALTNMFFIFFATSLVFFLLSIVHFVYCLYHALSNKVSLF